MIDIVNILYFYFTYFLQRSAIKNFQSNTIQRLRKKIFQCMNYFLFVIFKKDAPFKVKEQEASAATKIIPSLINELWPFSICSNLLRVAWHVIVVGPLNGLKKNFSYILWPQSYGTHNLASAFTVL